MFHVFMWIHLLPFGAVVWRLGDGLFNFFIYCRRYMLLFHWIAWNVWCKNEFSFHQPIFLCGICRIMIFMIFTKMKPFHVFQQSQQSDVVLIISYVYLFICMFQFSFSSRILFWSSSVDGYRFHQPYARVYVQWLCVVAETKISKRTRSHTFTLKTAF